MNLLSSENFILYCKSKKKKELHLKKAPSITFKRFIKYSLLNKLNIELKWLVSSISRPLSKTDIRGYLKPEKIFLTRLFVNFLLFKRRKLQKIEIIPFSNKKFIKKVILLKKLSFKKKRKEALKKSIRYFARKMLKASKYKIEKLSKKKKKNLNVGIKNGLKKNL